MMTIEQIIVKYDFKKRKDNLQIDIQEIEKEIGFPLPNDYAWFVKNYTENERFIGKEFVRLWDFEEITLLNREYNITEYLKNTLAIGENGGGEFIAVEFSETAKYRIILSPFIDLNEKYHIEIGSSFTNFFQRLENGEEWFS